MKRANLFMALSDKKNSCIRLPFEKYWRRRVSTVDFLVLASLYQLHLILKIFLTLFTKQATSDKCTEASPAISNSWILLPVRSFVAVVAIAAVAVVEIVVEVVAELAEMRLTRLLWLQHAKINHHN